MRGLRRGDGKNGTSEMENTEQAFSICGASFRGGGMYVLNNCSSIDTVSFIAKSGKSPR